MAVQLSRRRFTVDEYYWMARVGILREDDRVELIDGEIVEMPPIGPPHHSRVTRLNRLFHDRFADVALVAVQGPVRLDQYNEPEPDVVLVRLRADFYATRHAGPDDVFLVVEVADSSLATDRTTKALMYAQANIPDMWILDIPHELVLVHREPTRDGYRVVTPLRRGESIAPLVFPDRPIAVDEMLG